jgi:hypothetical protein
MAQNCTVIQADPGTLAVELAALNEEILIVQKTASAGKFIVISQAPSTSQTFTVVAGDPDKLASEIDTIALGATVNLVIPTFSAAHYVVVST